MKNLNFLLYRAHGPLLFFFSLAREDQPPPGTTGKVGSTICYDSTRKNENKAINYTGITRLLYLGTTQAPLQPEVTAFYDFVQSIGDNLM